MLESSEKHGVVAQSSALEGQIDLRELFDVIWAGKITVIVFTIIITILAVLLSLSKPNIYRASALLAPASEEKQSGLAGLAGQFGGLASLAGVRLGSSGNQTTQTLAILQSREFTNLFISKHDLLIPLFATKARNYFSKGLVVDETVYDVNTNTWVGDGDGDNKPSAWRAYYAFSGCLSVSENVKTGLITVAIDWYDPKQAKQWVDWLIEDLNEEIKSKDVSDAEKSISYLKESLKKTSVIGFQEVFYSLIESQTKTVMLAEIREEYALKTLDPAVVSEQKLKPKRAVICMFGVLIGGVFGILYVFLKNITPASRSQKE